MARKRALSSTPAAIAAAAPPPAASTAVEPNCAAPANTKADMTMAPSGPMTGRATTPKDKPSRTAAAPKGSPARTPSRMVAGRSAAGSVMARHPNRDYPRGVVATTLPELINGSRVLDLTHPLSPEFPLFPVYNPVEVAERFSVERDG